MAMPSSPAAQIVWFDMGNVLLHFSRQVQAHALRGLPGCQREETEIIPLINGSAEHVAYELGQLDRDTFLTWLADFLGTTAPLEQVEEAYTTLFARNGPVCDLAASVARVLPVGLASNTDVSHLSRARRDYPETMSLFSEQRTVASCDCGHRKPARGFFDCMIARSGCAASALCFIDDLPANVAGAREAGITSAIVFDGNIDRLLADLQVMVGPVQISPNGPARDAH
jgi:putative hydrolase of the HAD superfamily